MNLRIEKHLFRPLSKMYYKHPHENWFQKGVRAVEGAVEGGLKIYGTARGVYEAGSAIATGIRSGYQIAAPMLAMI